MSNAPMEIQLVKGVVPPSAGLALQDGSRGRVPAWGGKLVENLVQSTARRVMAGASQRPGAGTANDNFKELDENE